MELPFNTVYSKAILGEGGEEIPVADWELKREWHAFAIDTFTKAEYDQAIEDRANSKLDEQDNGYARARLDSYGSWNEQLDLLYHDMTAGKGDKTGEWYKAVKKVKDDNPKPS